MEDAQHELRQHLAELLKGGNAHMPFASIVEDWPEKLRGAKNAILPYTPWQLLEHIRLAQWDILEFSRDPKHVSPEWPEGYWPKDEAPKSKQWEESVETVNKGLRDMIAIVTSPKTDLYAKIPHGEGQTILREALLLADHNAYHMGQLMVLKKILGNK